MFAIERNCGEVRTAVRSGEWLTVEVVLDQLEQIGEVGGRRVHRAPLVDGTEVQRAEQLGIRRQQMVLTHARPRKEIGIRLRKPRPSTTAFTDRAALQRMSLTTFRSGSYELNGCTHHQTQTGQAVRDDQPEGVR